MKTCMCVVRTALPMVLLISCLSSYWTADAAQASGAMFPDVVARVNGQPVSGSELEPVIRRELAALDNPAWNDLQPEYRNQLAYAGVLSIIDSRLLFEKALAADVRATPAEVDEAVATVAKNYASDAELNAALARQFLTRDTLRQRAEQELTIRKYVNKLAEAVAVVPEEVSKYYAEHPDAFAHPEIIRASHILLRGDEKPDLDAEAKARAEALLARAQKGEDFAKLARENSVDNTASVGGDIGYAAKDALDNDFAAAAFSMKVGDVRLVKTRHGYHVIKLTDKKPEGVSTLDEIRDELTALLRQSKAQSELDNLIQTLREQAKVEVLIPSGL
ncbi:MAG: peptidylprolyl isomerase [Acidobacteriota bacterium]|nr:peptidylprolyl isomerase [Acidobacteriota bacterium]